MINIWHVLLCFAAGAVFPLAGVFLGAFMVYRTKRDPYDSFVRFKQPKGQAFNLDDGLEMTDEEGPPPLPDIIKKMNEKVKSQLGGEADAGN